MKKIVSLLCFISLAFFAAPGRSATVDRVVAVVNSEPITLYQFEEWKAAQGAAASSQRGETPSTLSREEWLEKMIDEKLLDQEMARRQIDVSDEDVQRALGNIMQRNNLDKAKLVEQLSKRGMSYDAYVADLRVQLKKMKFMGQTVASRVKVTDADLEEFFSQNPEKFSNYQSVEMAQVIVSLPLDADEAAFEAARLRAAEVVKKAKSGSKFEELGKKYSQNPSMALPATYAFHQLAPQILEAISELKPGEVSEPVRSEQGFHVIKLLGRKTLVGDEYQAAREQMREKLFEEKLHEELQKYLRELKSKSYVEKKAF